MTSPGDPGRDDPWRAWSEAGALGWAQALGGRAAGGPSPGLGLDGLATWYRTVAEGLRDAMLAAPSDPAAFHRRLETFATSFFTGAGIPGGGLAGAGPASWLEGAAFGFAMPPATGTAARPGPAALGPAREHQQRGAALASALAELAAAQQALAPLLAEAGRAAATNFAARTAGAPPQGARATFDQWIECAESAWQDLAHGEAWCAAQARAFDAALSVVACQQELAEHAARLAGLPGRREIDDLHRRVRDLERGRDG